MKREDALKLDEQVKARVREILDFGNELYGLDLPMPKVTYFNKGGTGGWWRESTREISLHAGLLKQNVDEYMNQTIPHEMAHCFDHALHPENFESSITYDRNGRLRRTKRTVHGPTWKAIMRDFGCNPDRCHSMDTSTVKRKRTNIHVYKCTCGKDHEMALSTVRHKRQQYEGADYYPVSHRCRYEYQHSMKKDAWIKQQKAA